jgi:hypothetical protein
MLPKLCPIAGMNVKQRQKGGKRIVNELIFPGNPWFICETIRRTSRIGKAAEMRNEKSWRVQKERLERQVPVTSLPDFVQAQWNFSPLLSIVRMAVIRRSRVSGFLAVCNLQAMA